MSSIITLVQRIWEPCSLILLGAAGIFGLVALVSPQSFKRMAEFGGRWLDSSKITAQLDRRIDVDRLVLPHSRMLGAAVLASVAILCFRFSTH